MKRNSGSLHGSHHHVGKLKGFWIGAFGDLMRDHKGGQKGNNPKRKHIKSDTYTIFKP